MYDSKADSQKEKTAADKADQPGKSEPAAEGMVDMRLEFIAQRKIQRKAEQHAEKQQPLKNQSPSTQGTVQRMVYEDTTKTLFTDTAWGNASNADGKKVSAALNERGDAFIDKIKGRISEPYGLNAYDLNIENNSNAAADDFAKSQLEGNRNVQMDLLEEQWETANSAIQNKDQKKASFLNKMNQASGERRFNALKNLGGGLSSIRAGVRAGVQKVANQNSYLLALREANLHGGDATQTFDALMPKAKAVLLPQDYLEDDSDSNVDFNLASDKNFDRTQKTKVCSLISMIYQQAASASTKLLAKQKVSQLMGKFGVSVSASSINAGNIQSGKFLPKDNELYNTLVAGLHRVIQGRGDRYDLDRYGESMLSSAGYTRIVACNCDYKNLPANIPAHITLAAGTTYIFHIKGHAQAVLIKQDIVGELGASSPTTLNKHADYFTDFNETSSNYNLNWWTKNITAIWKA